MTPDRRFPPAQVSECSQRLHRTLARYFNRAQVLVSPHHLRLYHRAPDLSQRLRCAPPLSFYRAQASAPPRSLPLLRARASVSTRPYHRAQVSAYHRRRRARVTPILWRAQSPPASTPSRPLLRAATTISLQTHRTTPSVHSLLRRQRAPAPLASTPGPSFARMLLSASTRTTRTVTSTHQTSIASTANRVHTQVAQVNNR